ncbi:MAG: hypothetical protein WDZ38_04985, partial [Balneolaceae bacterium]
FSDSIQDAPSGYSFALYSYQSYIDHSTEIIITAPEWNQKLENSIRSIRNVTSVGTVIMVKTKEWEKKLNSINPHLENYPIGDRITFYICTNFECKSPVYEINEVIKLLK